NDDGEPSGTAGKPILGQLLSFEVSDVLAVVVRYFGGTKLGASGLIHAYKTATADALVNGEKIEKILKAKYKLIFPAAELGHVFHVMKTLDLEFAEPEYGEEVQLAFFIRLSEEMNTLVRLKSLLWKCPSEQATETEDWSPYKLEKL